MKRKLFTRKNFIWFLICVLCLLVALGFKIARENLVDGMESQQMAARWSPEGGYGQISCFFSENAGVSVDQLRGFSYQLDNALMEASIQNDSENSDARLFVTAYSGHGRISVSSDRTTLSINAYGVGGDFFQFHPQELLYGGYFAESDLNQDYIVIDEDAAWQLFGSSDIAGKIVFVNGKPHMISGVIRRPQGRMEKAAGLDTSFAFVSYQTLSDSGSSGIDHFEIVMPDPIKNFAMDQVKQLIGVDEREVEIVQNTRRYSLLNSLKILMAFGTRSMNSKAIVYPYWENLARGYEDVVALLSVCMVLFVLFPVIVLLLWSIGLWRHKTWTVKSVFTYVGDKIRLMKESIWAKQAKKRRKV